MDRSDECGRLFVYRIDGTRFQREHVQMKDGSGRKTVPVWSFFCSRGPGQLVRIQGRLTGQQYIQILNNNLLPYLQEHFPCQIIHFVQDNSPIHKSRIVTNWLREQPQLNVLPWPAKSADLNPIENVWGDIVKDMEPFRPRQADEVFEKFESIWNRYSQRPDYWRILAHSFRRRLQQVIDAEGYWTKY